MSNISAEEWQLISFFGVEPIFRDANVPWCYNDATYKVQQSSLSLSFAIAPAYRDVRIVLEYDGLQIYELNAMSLKDVRYSNEGGTELLDVIFSERNSLMLRIQPRIELSHSVQSG